MALRCRPSQFYRRTGQNTKPSRDRRIIKRKVFLLVANKTLYLYSVSEKLICDAIHQQGACRRSGGDRAR